MAVKLSAAIAVEIVGIFALMFVGIVVAALWFVRSSSRAENQKELQEKKMEILDKHFTEIARIECPHCKTLYPSDEQQCPSCGANTKEFFKNNKIDF